MPAHHAAARAAGKFARDRSSLELQPLGRGLINDTFLVSTGVFRFVLQRINRHVFPDPAAVMSNLRTVTEHVRRVHNRSNHRGWRLPELIPTLAGEDFHRDDEGACWRAITFIENSHGLPAVKEPGQAEQVGRALGRFHMLVGGLPPDSLHDTLPGFHVTPLYLARFDEMLRDAPPQPASPELREALDFVETRRPGADVLENARHSGALRLRVIHGDPKLDNVLFDNHTGQAVSLIDLDTVKPGLIHYDLGDCFRSCCNTAREGHVDGAFDPGIFRPILKGYLAEAADILTQHDRDYFHDAIRLLPFELGLRFLIDHLAGDVYFKVAQPGDNLIRALGQFRLARSVEAQEGEIRKIVADFN